jgi:hypothetical protein
MLSIGGYLALDQVNGVAGDSALKALATFKEAVYLEHPTKLGAQTIEMLATLDRPQPVTEQKFNPDLKPMPQAGSKTGETIRLPKLGEKHLNEWILPNSYLTFAEFTHGGTRIPETEQQIENMLKIAKIFGEIRQEFGSALAVTSAFRPPALNRKIGGRPNSFSP